MTKPIVIEKPEGKSFDVELSKYPDSLVFTRPRRLHEEFWRRMMVGYGPDRAINYLEVGCQEGSGLIWFLDNILGHSDSRATAVDVFAHGFKPTLEHNLRVGGYENKVSVKHGVSGEVLRSLPLYSFDVIYIDGLHAAFAVLEDAVLCWRLLKNGGVMIFDDYQWRNRPSPLNQPKPAIDFFLAVYVGKYQLLAKEYQLAIRKTYPDSHLDRYLDD